LLQVVDFQQKKRQQGEKSLLPLLQFMGYQLIYSQVRTPVPEAGSGAWDIW
jgi:hypothetical protein